MRHLVYESLMRRRTKRSRAGFSLIELMVVIAIIAMLATAVGVQMFGALDEGNMTTAKTEIKNFKTALLAYKIAFKKMPTTEQGLQALVDNPKRKFLDATSIPNDPWGNPYVYRLEGGSNYTIISYGEDGTSGGTGVNADISSDNLAGDQ